MFKEYISFCATEFKTIAAATMLQNQFNVNNILFFTPKHEQCETWAAFEVRNVSDNNYQKHMAKKEAAKDKKKLDTDTIINDKTTILFVEH